jgi:hypothetical protein
MQTLPKAGIESYLTTFVSSNVISAIVTVGSLKVPSLLIITLNELVVG